MATGGSLLARDSVRRLRKAIHAKAGRCQYAGDAGFRLYPSSRIMETGIRIERPGMVKHVSNQQVIG